MHTLVIHGSEWLNSNDRRNRYAQNRLVQEWKANARWAARRAGLRRMARARITATFIVPNDRRDTGNLYPTAKACIDGIRDNWEYIRGTRRRVAVPGWLPDDDARHVDGPHMQLRVRQRADVPEVELLIEELGP